MKYTTQQYIYFAQGKEIDALHFNWLFRAISLVEKKYLNYTVHNGDEKAKRYHKERVFAYELYRQWANILVSECKESLILNAELDKIIDERISSEDSTGSVDNSEEFLKYPDLVLHQDQGSDKIQKIICEVKRNTDKQVSASAIFADLYKLACYMDENKFHTGKKPFEYGVFILLNGKLEQIKGIKKTKIKVSENDYRYLLFKKEMNSHFDNIICITYDGAILEYKTLKGLL